MARAARTVSVPDLSLENELSSGGFRSIAGVDEAGRGCVFGPVFAAAVILDPREPLPGLDDSKRLDAHQREQLDARIRETARAYAVCGVDAATIDLLNILEGSRLAMKRAVESLATPPDFLLVDAVKIDLEIAQRGVIKGDQKSCSIAAASILAKVARDRCMAKWDKVYPAYGLRSHKGYPVPAHLAAIRTHGSTPLHRQSYGPVARLAKLDPRVPESS